MMYGISIGRVMRKKTKLRGTPSSSAASKGCFGKARKPAIRSTMMNGV